LRKEVVGAEPEQARCRARLGYSSFARSFVIQTGLQACLACWPEGSSPRAGVLLSPRCHGSLPPSPPPSVALVPCAGSPPLHTHTHTAQPYDPSHLVVGTRTTGGACHALPCRALPWESTRWGPPAREPAHLKPSSHTRATTHTHPHAAAAHQPPRPAGARALCGAAAT